MDTAPNRTDRGFLWSWNNFKKLNGKGLLSSIFNINYFCTAVSLIATNMCEIYPKELCSQECVPVLGSYKCKCRPGYSLMADGLSCQENLERLVFHRKNWTVKMEKTKRKDFYIDRCKGFNPCQQDCHYNGSSIECSCNEGYELLHDKKNCRGNMRILIYKLHKQQRSGPYTWRHLLGKGKILSSALLKYS